MTANTETNQTSHDARLAKAMSHPLRFRILEALNETEASPSDIAEELNEPIGNVSYHVKVLESCQAIELVATKPVRGALEHFYRATARPYVDDDHWTRLPVSVRRQLFDTILQGAWEHIVHAAESSGLDAPQTHVSWTTLDLDEQGYQEVVELVTDTLERALAIKAESIQRLVDLPEAERQVRTTELTLMHYDVHASPRRRGPRG